jgi:acetyl esterase
VRAERQTAIEAQEGQAMIGATYLERGQPVVVLAAWRGSGSVTWQEGDPALPGGQYAHIRLNLRGRAKKNVLIRREDGSLVVRPFRGLRRPK